MPSPNNFTQSLPKSLRKPLEDLRKHYGLKYTRDVIKKIVLDSHARISLTKSNAIHAFSLDPVNPFAFVTVEPKKTEFEEVFGTNEIPITAWSPSMVEIGGKCEVAYFLDFARVTPAEFDALVAHLARQFSAPAAAVKEELLARGMPVLAANCTVTIPK